MGWLALVVAVLLVGAIIVWPLTRGRRFFTPDVAARAEDVANQVYAARPDDGFSAVPFDPVPRDPLTPKQDAAEKHRSA